MRIADDQTAAAPAPRRDGAARLAVAAGLAAIVALLAAGPAGAPGAGPAAVVAAGPPPPPLHQAGSLGAGDLFAALTAPDRSAEIDALRAIRRDLTSADDPRQRDAARDRLDALLDLEERRQPDVPAALVMSSLAARIDNAIAGLEQAARTVPVAAAPTSTGARLTSPGLAAAGLGLAALAAAAASLGAGLAAALLGRRRLDRALAAGQQAYRDAAARLGAAAERSAQAGQADAAISAIVDAAAAAARDATLAAARLAGATLETEQRLRDCLDAVDARQGSARELARECDSMARNLPALLAGAVETAESRALPAVEAALGQLQGCAGDIASGLTALHDSTDALAAVAAGGARLAAGVGQAEAALAQVPDMVAEIGAAVAAAQLAAAPGMPTEAGDGDRADALTTAIARAEGFAAVLPDLTAGLAAAAAQLRRDAQAHGQTLADAGEALARAAEAARQMGVQAGQKAE
jgi:exonuclease SbcC